MIVITPIPALDSNYFWLLNDSTNTEAVIVDPGEAKPVLSYVEKHGLSLSAIVITHRHPDHTGGINELRKEFDIPVFGPVSKKIPQITHHLRPGQTFQLFSNNPIEFMVLSTPGHTSEHLSYFGLINNQPSLFCGDVLFAAGCGRLFDGPHQALMDSINTLEQFPDNTSIYCGHEYTLDNLRFAQAVENENDKIHQRLESVKKLRDNGIPSLPTTLKEEKETNPYLRLDSQNLITNVENYWGKQFSSKLDVFTHLRKWKDVF